MPIYEFRNKETNAVHTAVMGIKEKAAYLAANTDLETYFSSAPSLGDAIRLGLKKPDDGFREVLARVIEKTPGAAGLNNQLSRSSKRSF